MDNINSQLNEMRVDLKTNKEEEYEDALTPYLTVSPKKDPEAEEEEEDQDEADEDRPTCRRTACVLLGERLPDGGSNLKLRGP